MAETHRFTKGEEIANAITHGVGALLSITALIFLIVFASLHGTSLHVISFTIFGITMVLLYISSTLVHALPQGKAKDIFEVLDHSSIYLFIAGTYTPITLIVIQGTLGWTLFCIIWVLAIAGIVFKSFFVKKYLITSTILYILMGWLVVIGWRQLVSNLESNGLLLLVTGGILYTIGAVFYVWRGFKFHHMIWHLFVIAGTATHFFCVLLYLL